MQLLTESTAVSAIYNMVIEAENNCGIFLEQDLQSFVVYALLRNINNNQLKDFVFATELLNAVNTTNRRNLEAVLDNALIYAGMYPQRANKSGLSTSYYHDIGVAASSQLSVYYANLNSSYQNVYKKISTDFSYMITVLKSFIIPNDIEKLVMSNLRGC